MGRIADARLVAAIPFKVRSGERELLVTFQSEDAEKPSHAEIVDVATTIAEDQTAVVAQLKAAAAKAAAAAAAEPDPEPAPESAATEPEDPT